jgi:hypothetical protein
MKRMENLSAARVICRTPGIVMRRGSSMSCHARQVTRAGEHSQDEAVVLANEATRHDSGTLHI